MLEVGLTGGIACGKTAVRRRFDENGIPTLDADAVVHRLFEPNTSVSRELETHFGAKVLAADGSVDRKALGAIVFQYPSERRRLEAIVHPRVLEAIDSFFEAARDNSAVVAVVDAALMYETGSHERYDQVVVAYCSRELQKQRLMRRDALSEEQAERRIGAQMPAAEKRDRADYVIDTSGTMEQTLQRADTVLEQLMADAAKAQRKGAKTQGRKEEDG